MPPAIVGPGHDLPPESPFAAEAPIDRAPPRIEGPGDAHDWPWNRRAERGFPEEEPKPETATAATAERRANPEREPAQPSPAHSSAGAAEPSAPAAEPDEPRNDEPSGPPRKGWWRRLTS